MRAAILVLALGAALPASAEPPRAVVEGLLAADAAVWAPPDLKRQLVRNRKELMKGVADAVAAPSHRDEAAHRRAAVRAAQEIARRIREHAHFADVAYEIGGLVHECAAVGGLPPQAPASARFLGFPADPFRSADALLSVPPGADRWDAALTRATRLVAFVWKNAGGDASIALRTPESKGPYPVRE